MKPRAPERGTRRYFDCFTFSLTLVVPFLVVSTLAAKEPPLERLVEFNREALFGGGTVKVDKGRLALRFPEGTMRRGFRTSGKVVGELGGVPKHLREKYVKGTEKQFSCFGMSSGSASSRFEVGSDFKLSF